MRSFSSSFLFGSVGVVGVLVLVAGCPAPEIKPAERLCTPASNVYCRCADRREGTHRCNDRGSGFVNECDCGESNDRPDSDDASFDRIDAGPVDGANPIDDACAGKLAVIAGTGADDDKDTYGAAYRGNGEWIVSKSGSGNGIKSTPRGALIDNALVAVWQGQKGSILWTKFQANQESIAPPFYVGYLDSTKGPAIASNQLKGRIFTLAQDDSINEGTYLPSTGWDYADFAVPAADTVKGKGEPAAASLTSGYVVAYTNQDKRIFVQAQPSGKWQAPVEVAGTVAVDQAAPALVALGAEDLLLAYRGEDQVIRWTARTASKWSAPALLDTTARANDAPSLVSMRDGRALLAWVSGSGEPFFSIYDATKNPRWTPPANLAPQKTTRLSPALAQGRCASAVTAAYADTEGNVFLGLFTSEGKWTGPYAVPGLSKITYVAAGEVP